MAHSIPGFAGKGPMIMMVKTHPSGATSYHTYQGGPHWVATIPERMGVAEDSTFSVKVPSLADVVRGLTPIFFPAQPIRDFPVVEIRAVHFFLRDKTFEVSFSQNPPIEKIGSFRVGGKIIGPLDCFKGRATLQFDIEDVFGVLRRLSLRHDGHNQPTLGIKAGDQFYKVESIWSDGIRLHLKFHYRLSNSNVVTLYVAPPSGLYTLGNIRELDRDFLTGSSNRTFVVDNIGVSRDTEVRLLKHGGSYALGRIGAEVAYKIATSTLSLKQVVLNDPSKGGKDLSASGGTAVIQCRLLARTQHEGMDDVRDDLRRELFKLRRKLSQDFRYNPQATKGYAILTYVTVSQRLRSIVTEFLPT
ncbi:MAG: hypothetical protein KGI38_05670 [Thaumarchaeota archaeon]|nr:hypothetical protein [Nitrososphaerota archaeon]